MKRILILCLSLGLPVVVLAQETPPLAQPDVAAQEDREDNAAGQSKPVHVPEGPAADVADAAPEKGALGWQSKPVGHWAEQLGDEDKRVQWYATYALGQLGPKAVDAVPALIVILEDTEQHEYVRGTAAWALGRIGDQQAVPVLIDTLKSSQLVSVRRNASAALGNLRQTSKEAVPRLLELLKDPDPTVRVNSAVALWKIEKNQQAFAKLVDMIQKDNDDAYEATVALGGLEAEASVLVPALVGALQRNDLDLHRAAARAIGKIGPVAIPELAAPLKDRRPEVRRAAVEALGWMGEPAIDALIAALDNEAAEARAAAARALGRLGPKAKAAVPKLVERIRDPDPEVCEAAAKAESKINKP